MKMVKNYQRVFGFKIPQLVDPTIAGHHLGIRGISVRGLPGASFADRILRLYVQEALWYEPGQNNDQVVGLPPYTDALIPGLHRHSPCGHDRERYIYGNG